MGCDKPQLYWGSVVGSLLVAILLTLLVVQSWYDRQAAEKYSYNHLMDAAHQVEKSITTVYGSHQLLADAIASRFNRAATAPIPGCNPICDAELHSIQERFDRLLPTADILVLNANGETLAETEAGMRTGLSLLPNIVEQLQAGALMLVLNGRNNSNVPSFIIGKALQDRSGKLQAMLVFTLPFAELAAHLKLPKLGAQGVLSVFDDQRRLVAREPQQFSVAPGETVPPGSEQRAGLNQGSFVVNSSLDGVERLMVKRQIPFNLAEGGLILFLGMSFDELLAGWQRSTMINLFCAGLLLLGWFRVLMLMQRSREMRQQVQVSLAANQQLLEEIPLPVVLVNRMDSCIDQSNRAMVESFGAMACIGEPITRLFRDERSWHDLPMNTHREVREMVTRNGRIHAEVHRTEINGLTASDSLHWLVILVDVSVAHQQAQQLLLDALTDPLTGLANRRHFDDGAASMVLRCQQQRQELAVLSFDIDHFKRVNDQYGHDVGDQVLGFVAQRFKNCLRECDLAARLGGEEFSALLPGANHAQALAVGERIRQSVVSNPVALADGQLLTITISIGVAMWRASEPEIQAALKRSDIALYQAKKQGRNRVVSYAAPLAADEALPVASMNEQPVTSSPVTDEGEDADVVDKSEGATHPQLAG